MAGRRWWIVDTGRARGKHGLTWMGQRAGPRRADDRTARRGTPVRRRRRWQGTQTRAGTDPRSPRRSSTVAGTAQDGRRLLRALQGLKGDWDFGDFTLTVQRVQADPFARRHGSGCRPDAGIPESAWKDPIRRRATADHLGRRAMGCCVGPCSRSTPAARRSSLAPRSR